MSLAKLIRAVQSELPITMRHETWMARNSDAKYSQRALDFAQRALSGEYQFRPRMRFRSSGIGSCSRRRIFSAIGMRELPQQDGKLANIFHTGNFLHLKWQMAGLTEGWLKEAEVVKDNPNVQFGGTLDGILHDGSGFEFKSINSNGAGWVRDKPKDIHLRQVHGYMYLEPSIEKFSVVYENKDTGDWRELRVERDDKLIRQIDREVGELNEAWDNRKLPPVLPDCMQQTGTTYRQCPFRDRCLTIKKWPTL
jgi:hypothetical protein